MPTCGRGVSSRRIVYEQIAPAWAPTETIIETWPFRSAMLTRGAAAGWGSARGRGSATT